MSTINYCGVELEMRHELEDLIEVVGSCRISAEDLRVDREYFPKNLVKVIKVQDLDYLRSLVEIMSNSRSTDVLEIWDDGRWKIHPFPQSPDSVGSWMVHGLNPDDFRI